MAELDRIRWRCRRGLLELDLVLETFQHAHLENMSPVELAAFSRLLDSADNDLWDWVSGRGEPPDPSLAGLVQSLRSVRHAA